MNTFQPIQNGEQSKEASFLVLTPFNTIVASQQYHANTRSVETPSEESIQITPPHLNVVTPKFESNPLCLVREESYKQQITIFLAHNPTCCWLGLQCNDGEPIRKALRDVIGTLYMPRKNLTETLGRFSEQIDEACGSEHAKSSTLLRYVIPLLSITYSTTPNHMQVFDEACLLIGKLCDMPSTDETVANTLLPILLQICMAGNVYSQIAYEATLRLLANVVANSYTLSILVHSIKRMNNEMSAIPFRLMRADFLRIFCIKATAYDMDLAKEALLEMQISRDEESTKLICSKYSLVCKECLELVGRGGSEKLPGKRPLTRMSSIKQNFSRAKTLLKQYYVK